MQGTHLTDVVNTGPIAIVTLTGLVVLAVEAFKRNSSTAAYFITQVGIVAAGIFSVANFGTWSRPLAVCSITVPTGASSRC